MSGMRFYALTRETEAGLTEIAAIVCGLDELIWLISEGWTLANPKCPEDSTLYDQADRSGHEAGP